MATITETLLAKADEFQRKADALRFAAETLNGHGSASVAKRLPATLTAAIALRQQARPDDNSNGHALEAKPPRGTAFAKMKATRLKTAEKLKQFSTTTPRPGFEHIGVLVQGGYLVRQGDGYLRTTKPFNPAPPHTWNTHRKSKTPTPTRHHKSKQLAAVRLAKARLVAQLLKEHGPMTAPQLTPLLREKMTLGPTGLTGIHNYVQAGYITKKKNVGGTSKDGGFIYTFKAMPPEPGAEA